MLTTTRLSAFAAFLSFSVSLTAQGIDPIGRVHPNAQRLSDVDSITMAPLDRVAIAAEDQAAAAAKLPARFAITNDVVVTPELRGTWEQLDGAWSLWRLRIKSPDASHVNLGFTRFALPDGARLMVYSADYRHILRPFDVNDNSPTGELWTPVVFGSEIVVEVYLQTAQRERLLLELTAVNSGYRMFGAGPTALGTDGSATCNVDVSCPSAAPWASEIRSVARITIGGNTLCSGVMVNNTAQDRKNYFLTADHCGAAGNPASVVAYWNYDNKNCGGPDDADLSQFSTGAVLRANNAASDFTLLELNSAPNVAWGVTYAGWNRTTATTVSNSAVGIHHPSGDTKKISFENNPTVTTSNGGTTSPGNGTHVRVIDWDNGVTEGGSSGSPLFDQDHRIIGQLHSGGSACGNNLSDWYGKFGVSWSGGGTNATRLSNWLDPLGTGANTIDTLVPPYALAKRFGVGCYQTNAAFYELFCGPDFDMSGTPTASLVKAFTPISGGYQIAFGTNTWFTPTSANLALADEGSTNLALPWSFAYPGGATSTVRMYANGYVFLSGAAVASDFSPTAAELCGGAARFAPLWIDLDPSLGSGACHYDVDPSGTAVYFTWLNVRAFGTTAGAGTNTFQLVLRQNQTVEYRYRQVANTPTDCMIGWSRGAAQVPAPTNLSSITPFSVTVDSGALTLVGANRPLQGTNQVLFVSNIPNPLSSIGIMCIGFPASGLELSFLGAPDCYFYNSGDVLVAWLPVSSTYVYTLPISSDPLLLGSTIAAQTGLLTPGVNAFGALFSNAVNLTFGTL
ncbi:MAG: trypsin-like peptidase domain-containing protein [Planctomycetes bacterium]|nr:trypsin-like peptidase domain-containing protein [Planctomycetota bacterium]